MDTPKQRVILGFGCEGLPRLDSGSQSDPFVVIEQQVGSIWKRMMTTEVVRDSQTCQWAKKWEIDYTFEVEQRLRLSVYDLDSGGTQDLTKHDFIGVVDTTVAQIVSSGSIQFPITNANPSSKLSKRSARGGLGSLVVNSEPLLASQQQTLTFHFSGEHLDKKDLLGKSDPYLQVSRGTANGGWELVHQTETIKKTLNPRWKPFRITLSALCNGDRERPLKFDVWDWDKTGGHDYIGGATYPGGLVQLEQQKNARGPLAIPLINEKLRAKKKKRYTNSGELILNSYMVEQHHSFVEYLQGGLQINLMVAIDFTASNGVPQSPQSLHYMSERPNEYQSAIYSVGHVLAPYDSDGMIPVYGYGAKVGARVDFCFPLTFQQNPEVPGVAAVLDVYRHAISQVQLYGPTNLAPTINCAAQVADSAGANSFLILLILTDGEITDMTATIDAIVAASSLPMAIIIVGVGGANFASMEKLDSDDELLKGTKGRAQADIVQFVPYRQFANNPEFLAAETLREVPSQVCEYFKRRGIKPNPPRQVRAPQTQQRQGFAPPPQ